jgi:hypothetical protein
VTARSGIFHRSAACLALAAALLIAGCGTIKVIAGHPVKPELVETSLVVGQSTASDVRRVLGEPHSLGRDRLPVSTRPRTVWSYHYEESQASLGGAGDYHRIFLLVFIADDRLDGYFWFSSFPEHRASP